MHNDFSKLFSNISSNQFNKVSLSNVQNILNIKTIGLHHIANASIVKESHLHSHSFSELHFSLNGYAIYQFANDRQLKLDKGNWLLIPADVPHKIIEYSSNYVKYSCSFKINTAVNDEKKYDIAYHCINNLLKENDIKYGEISDSSAKCIKILHSKILDKHPFSTIMVQSLTENILFDTLSALFNNIKYTNDQNIDTRFEIAIQFVRDNIYNQIDSGDVARKLYLSIRQIDRMFKKRLSVSVTEFIFEQKCEIAKQLLMSTSLPINSISEKLNFSDPAYFSRFFKKRVGLSPQQFRETNKLETNSSTDTTYNTIPQTHKTLSK